MKTNYLLAVVLVGLWACSDDNSSPGGGDNSPNTISLTEEQKTTVDGYTDFSYNLFKQTVNDKSDTDNNIIVSPWGAANILSMLSNGGDTEARQSIAKILNVSDADNLNSANKYLYNSLLGLSSKVDINVYRGLWVKDIVAPKDDVKSVLSTDYAAEYFTFSSPSSLQINLNSWITNKSKGTIKTILIYPTEKTVAAIADMLYFKGEWQRKFSASSSNNSKFYNYDGTTSDIIMMGNTLDVNRFQPTTLKRLT